jgi:hypothetical protein
MKKLLILLLLCCSVICFAGNSGKSASPSHKLWTEILHKYVNEQGWVNYKGIIKDKKQFQEYLDILSNNPPQDDWSKNDQEAYWINAYNAFTIKLILDHYPVTSIKDIGPKHEIVRIYTPWTKRFIHIGKRRMKLDHIEHNILLKKFGDERIHFAIVCASRSCAKLRNEAYEGRKLDAQLDEQRVDFLTNPKKNKIKPEKAELSSYFDWYKHDFKKNGTVIEYINKYSPVKIHKDAKISYLDYDWDLNEQK